ncbi:MAG: hypothetical protein ACOCXJ_06575 [Planctomycetota bacterium]
MSARRSRLLLPLCLAGIGLALVAWSVLRQPRIATRVEPGIESVVLRVRSEPAGAQVAIRLRPPTDPVQVDIAGTSITAGIGSGDWQSLGTTPLTGVRLPVTNRIVVSADHGWGRSDEQVITPIPTAYDLRLRLQGYEEHVIEDHRPDPARQEALVVDLQPTDP